MDHVGGIANHASIRALRASKPKVTYFIPSHLQQPLIKVLDGYSAMAEENIMEELKLQTIDPGEGIKVVTVALFISI